MVGLFEFRKNVAERGFRSGRLGRIRELGLGHSEKPRVCYCVTSGQESISRALQFRLVTMCISAPSLAPLRSNAGLGMASFIRSIGRVQPGAQRGGGCSPACHRRRAGARTANRREGFDHPEPDALLRADLLQQAQPAWHREWLLADALPSGDVGRGEFRPAWHRCGGVYRLRRVSFLHPLSDLGKPFPALRTAIRDPA